MENLQINNLKNEQAFRGMLHRNKHVNFFQDDEVLDQIDLKTV